jgi:hypothetical protein
LGVNAVSAVGKDEESGLHVSPKQNDRFFSSLSPRRADVLLCVNGLEHRETAYTENSH